MICGVAFGYVKKKLYLRANKSFLRAITKIGYLEPTDKMIEELRKELNNVQIDLSKLYDFKNKTSKTVTVELWKEDFILPIASRWTNQVLKFDIDAPNNLKNCFDSTRTALEKADKVPAPDNIKASVDAEIENFKNASISVNLQCLLKKTF